MPGQPFDPPVDTTELARRAALHAALGEPIRLAVADDLVVSDRSPKELGGRLAISSNLLAHHLDVLEAAGVVQRFASSGDRRRKYVRLTDAVRPMLAPPPVRPAGPVLFVCSRNTARSKLAAALWRARTGSPAASAGTHPDRRVHRGTVAAARRAGLTLDGDRPAALPDLPDGMQVVTVCDRAHEELAPAAYWWHWSLPDPVEQGTSAAFDAVVAALDHRITVLTASGGPNTPSTPEGTNRR